MRVALHDDFGVSRCAPSRTDTVLGWTVALDGDWPGKTCGCATVAPPESPPATGLPTLAIRERSRMYFGPDGEPHYEWTDVVSGPALLLEERSETNDATGQTKVTATAAVAWESGTPPRETAVAHDSRGYRWEVVSCQALPGRLQLKLERIDDGE